MDWEETAKEIATKNYGEITNTTHQAFLRGVLWQRDQTRIPEAIERTAIGLLAIAADLTHEEAKTDWPNMYERAKEGYRNRAMHLTNITLGDR